MEDEAIIMKKKVVAVCIFLAGMLGIKAGFAQENVRDMQRGMHSQVTVNKVSQAKSYYEEPETEVQRDIPEGNKDWKLVLVNRWNPIPSGYMCKRTQLMNGHSIDTRCYDQLQDMMDACRQAGCKPKICSSYRMKAKQKQLFQEQVNKYLNRGYSKSEATKRASTSVAIPGTSEHQLGLAVDILDGNYLVMDRTQENTKTQKWLMKNSWKYGFILRYPPNKRKITGIIYEPWHYRFVGKKAAKEIYKRNICLEEYLK